MSLALDRLLTLEVTLLRRRQDGDPDEYGNPAWRVVSEDTLPAELQMIEAYEAHGGALEIALWRLYLPAVAPPTGWDAVDVDGEIYELEGDAWLVRNPRTGVNHHVEARVRRTR